MSRSNKPIEAKAARMVQRLRDIHALGKAYRKSNLTAAKFAALHATSDELVYKAKRFATTYDRADLKRLCGLRRRGSDLPVHWGHVLSLIFLPSDAKRRQYEHKIVANDWTAPQLRAAIKNDLGVRHPSTGRRVVLNGQFTGRLATITSQADLWRRRAALLTEQDLAGLHMRRELVADCVTVLQQVQREAARILTALQRASRRPRNQIR